MNMFIIEFHSIIFASFLCFLGPPSLVLEVYHLKRGVMPLFYVVLVKCKQIRTTEIKAQVHSIWAKRCILDNCMCIN